MECKNAYLKNGTPYILCRQEAEPVGHDKKLLFHAMCPYQIFCKTAKCHKLTPEWERCFKLAPVVPQEPASEPNPVSVPVEAPKKKTRRKAAETPQGEAEVHTESAESATDSE